MGVRFFVFFRHLEGRMNCIERDVKEERFFFGEALDEPHRFTCDQVRAVALIASHFIVPVPIESPLPIMIEIVYLPVVMAILLIETAVSRKIAGKIMA